jgi:FlaA1/EpsC-like NDP-sugar epimerase
MGEPVRIQGVAEQLIQQSGKRIEIVHTGLREGEKLHEDLFGESEPDHRPVHELISHVDVPPLATDDVRAVELAVHPLTTVHRFHAWCSPNVDYTDLAGAAVSM